MTGTRLPHSEIPGSKRACRSPRLIAACRVLRRLPSPRHPSCALTSLTTKKSIRIDCRICGAGALHPRVRRTSCAHVRPLFPGCPVRAHFDSRSYACAVVKEPSAVSESVLSDPACAARPGAACRGTLFFQVSCCRRRRVPHPACLTAAAAAAAARPVFRSPCWWACLESNQGPRPYQGRALTN